ncbi:hypothetical protein SPHINGO391_470458 [Sphingomonas aurantiaca]|uniref:Uncharacterized protein n=1 Tax=Sphingomonas aurantiaca TaxID=185949 RepID=A0A5E7ZVM9_9SPHN|nr:hypothetical protein SPHINGO391_470458 [Sphingomonas aurantiaca]
MSSITGSITMSARMGWALPAAARNPIIDEPPFMNIGGITVCGRTKRMMRRSVTHPSGNEGGTAYHSGVIDVVARVQSAFSALFCGPHVEPNRGARWFGRTRALQDDAYGLTANDACRPIICNS